VESKIYTQSSHFTLTFHPYTNADEEFLLHSIICQ